MLETEIYQLSLRMKSITLGHGPSLQVIRTVLVESSESLMALNAVENLNCESRKGTYRNPRKYRTLELRRLAAPINLKEFNESGRRSMRWTFTMIF